MGKRVSGSFSIVNSGKNFFTKGSTMQTSEEKKKQMMETAELIEAFKAGKQESFDKLVVMYSPQLYRTAYGLLGSKQDAEEVVQDAFVRAFRALNNFRGDSSFETWMHRITINLARNKFHWNRRRGEGLMTSISRVSDDEGEQRDLLFPDDRLRPDFSMENSEIEKQIMNGLSSLPDSLRETMVLRHISDLPYEKIAEQLDCKVGTVKSRLARGRELLREYLISKEIPANEARRRN
ncbi:MAG: sigma-70 family RNA polymerase sigma factor [Lentisphaerae bacterium]|nr:sigma-70 family RNA polymerase sigma factor [Lentisphaerota bacterium]